MAPTRPGGRPRNAWTSSRRRKLVRLYTLTSLDKEEIGRVLIDEDFSPSSSDIQKKLRSLFPRDYAKEYRQFRPMNDKTMRRRLSHLPRRSNGVVRRQKRHLSLVSSKNSRSPTRIHTACARSSTANNVLAPQNADVLMTISPHLLLQKPSSPNVLWHTSPINTTQSAGYTHDIASDEPSLIDSVASIVENESQLDTVNHTNMNNSSRSRAILNIRERLKQSHSISFVDHVTSVIRYSSSNSWRSSIKSITSLASSFRSILSYDTDQELTTSSTGNLNSDDESPANQLRLAGTATQQILTRGEQLVWEELVDESKLLPGVSPLPEYSGIGPGNRPCCGISPSKRNPDTLFWQPDSADLALCPSCGMSKAHYWAARLHVSDVSHLIGHNMFQVRRQQPLSPEKVVYKIMATQVDWWNVQSFQNNPFSKKFLETEDNFGNTCLHFAASSIDSGIATVIALIRKGANIHAWNSSGQSFLHVLRLAKVLDEMGKWSERCADDYVHSNLYSALFLELQKRGFDFHKSDFHGRTVYHVLLEMYPSYPTGCKWLSELVNTTHPHLNRYDSHGNSLKHLLLRDAKYHDQYRGADDDSILPANLMNGDLEFSAEICNGGYGTLALFASRKFCTWIDKNGDTILSSLLEGWQDDGNYLQLAEQVSGLLDAGGEIHMRNRQGDTVLAIAARRGIRPVVTMLIARGANIHARNYGGKGILSQCRRAWLKARKNNDDKLYAGILSCINALVDAGAKDKPTERDEWMTPAARALEEAKTAD